jgi:PAS domain S-box-containing protein
VEDLDAVVWESDPARGRFLYVSRGAEVLLGHPASRWVEEPDFFAGLVHPDDRAEALDACRRLTLEGHDHTFEFRARHADGRTLWLRNVVRSGTDPASGETRGRGIMVDVTAMRQAQEALRESEGLYRTLVTALDEGVLLVGRDLRVMAANAAAARILGLSPEEVNGLSLVTNDWRAIQEDGSPFPLESYPVLVTLNTGQPCQGVVMGATGPDGVLRWLSINSQPLIRPGADVPYAVVASLTDITVRKQVEAHLRETQKLEAVGRLAGGVAHDFNNLLTAIGGYAELLLSDPGPAAGMRADLQQIRRAAERAATLTRQLLAFSRRQTLAPRVVDLEELMADMERIIQRLVGAHIRLEIAAHARPARVKADPGQLEQVLLNLAINARDAMPAGGVLTLATDVVILGPGDGRGPVGMTAGRYVCWSVGDTGEGMDRATRERIFEPFFTTKDRRQGTGLGLASVYGIVRQSGGSIEVESEPGQGTTFHIYLPESLEPPAEPEPVAMLASGPVGHETVLVVEDEPTVRSLMCTVLRGHGYRVLEAEDGRAALERSAAEPGAIDLLVSDVVMPGLQGPELAERLRVCRPGLRVLHVSGYSDTAVARQGLLGAGTPLLQKPFAPQALLRHVREVLDDPAPDA